MAQFKLFISAAVDGKNIPGFPLSVEQTIAEQQSFDYNEAGDSDDTTFSALPVQELTTVEVLALRAVAAIGLRLEGGEATNVAIRLSASGGIVLWGATITDTNVTVNVNSATAAGIQGAAGGGV